MIERGSKIKHPLYATWSGKLAIRLAGGSGNWRHKERSPKPTSAEKPAAVQPHLFGGSPNMPAEIPPTVQQPGCLPPGFDSHSILSASECALWLRWSVAKVREKARAGQIPSIRTGAKLQSYRFSVGTIQTFFQQQSTKAKKQ